MPGESHPQFAGSVGWLAASANYHPLNALAKPEGLSILLALLLGVVARRSLITVVLLRG
jgi:hypothetical protein